MEFTDMTSNANSYNLGVALLIMLLSIALCWWSLLSLKFDRLVKEPGSAQAKMLHLILAVILGYQFGKFLLEYLHLSSLFGGVV